MTRELTTGRKGPAQGDAERIVVLLHGYGADGNDLLGLADPLMPHMPGTAFLAPNAPERCVNNPMGFQWFPIPWLDGSSVSDAAVSMARSVDDLNGFLDAVLRDDGIAPKDLMLLGFSQGTMMSLHVAPRREEPVAGIVGFSGRLLEPDRLKDELRVRPPVLLIHGDADEMVPPSSLPEAANALSDLEFEVYAHVSKGTGHGIAPDGLSVALSFMRDKLGLSGD